MGHESFYVPAVSVVHNTPAKVGQEVGEPAQVFLQLLPAATCQACFYAGEPGHEL